MAVAGEKTLQPHHIDVVSRTNDHRPDPLFHQADTAKDQRTHHVLANLGLFDHHVADARRGNGERLDVSLGDEIDERRPSGQLSELSGVHAGTDRDERVVRHDIVTLLGDDFALEDDVHGRGRFSGADQAFAVRKRAWLGITAQTIDFRRLQHRKHLVPTRFEGGRGL